jgi:hypothetical protein
LGGLVKRALFRDNPVALNPPFRSRLLGGFLLLILSLMACGVPSTPMLSGSPVAGTTPQPRPSATPFQPVRGSATPQAIRIWLAPGIPEALQGAVEQALRSGSGGLVLADSAQNSDVRLQPGGALPVSTWIYALVAAFPTVSDGVSFQALRDSWQAAQPDIPLAAASNDLPDLQSVFGAPPAQGQFDFQDRDALLDRTWSNRQLRAIVPFEALQPRWKVLQVDGQSPLSKAFDPDGYPLKVVFGLDGDPSAVSQVQAQVAWPASNRDPSKLTVLVMTGVSALTRATGWKMNLKGIDYPGQLIGDWLRQADIAHISHEVSFASNCPPPDPNQASLRFCGDPHWIGLFDDVGVDLIELTGNHEIDWGQQAFLDTLAMYHQRGWQTFGGGADLNSALQPALFEDHGNKLAFIGCNPAGPPWDWATASAPGSTPCQMDDLLATVGRLKAEGYLVVFTFQWQEAYRSTPLPDQVAGFRQAIDSGATIVSGSQAHQPQTFEFYDGGFIHYGLGNLFFDQMWSDDTRQEFIDRYVIYDGRLLGLDLLTAELEDWAQPRPMTAAERADFLGRMFAASGW